MEDTFDKNPHAEDEEAPGQRKIQECCNLDIFRKEKTKDIFRICLEGEKHRISLSDVFFKQLVALTLLFVVFWYVRIEAVFGDRRALIAHLFECGNTSKSVLNLEPLVRERYSDDGVSYCYFKSFMIVLSWVLLFPFFLESLSILNIILVSSVNKSVLIPISGGDYVGYAPIFNEVLSPNIFKRTLYSFAAIVIIPMRVIKLQLESSDTEGGSSWWIVWSLLWKTILFMLPDLAFTISLFGVSFLVMESSKTPDELFVNLVAVQVFATLDEQFVKIIMRPRRSVGESLGNYTRANAAVEKPKYNPFEQFTLSLNRHEWGVKVPGKTKLQDIHDYNGFHFTP